MKNVHCLALLFFAEMSRSSLDAEYSRAGHPGTASSLCRLAGQMVRDHLFADDDGRCVVLVGQPGEDVLPCVAEDKPIPVFAISSVDGKGRRPLALRNDNDTKVFGIFDRRKIWSSSPPPDLTDILRYAHDTGCTGYVIQVDDPAGMIKTLAEVTKLAMVRTEVKLLVLPVTAESSRLQRLGEVFSLPELAKFPNLLVVRPGRYCREDPRNATDKNARCFEKFFGTEAGDCRRFAGWRGESGADSSSCEEGAEGEEHDHLALVTHAFVGDQPLAEVLVDAWSPRRGELALQRPLYPDKTRDMAGRAVRVAAFTYLPFASVDQASAPPQHDGVDFCVVAELAARLNLSVEVVDVGDEFWGDVWENATGTGVSGALLADRADLGASGMFVWPNENRFMDFSHAYLYDLITCVAPRPQPLPRWLAPVRPFSKGLWAASLLLVAVGTFATLAVARLCRSPGPPAGDPLCTAWGCALLNIGMLTQVHFVDDRRPDKVPLRLMLACFAVVYMTVATCYGAGLEAILTLPLHRRPIDTVKQLVESGMPWAGISENFLALLKESEDPYRQQLVADFRVMTEKDMLAKVDSGDMAFVVEKLLSGNFAMGEHINTESIKKLRLMKEDFYWALCAFGLQKGSYLKAPLNKIVLQAVEAGLLAFWEDRTVRRHMDRRLQAAVRDSGRPPPKTPVQLSVEHVQGAFSLLVLGAAAAAAVFLAERAAWRRHAVVPLARDRRRHHVVYPKSRHPLLSGSL